MPTLDDEIYMSAMIARGVAALVATGVLLSLVDSCVSKDERAQEITATGDCGLPGIIAHATFFVSKTEPARESCILYAAPGSWHEASSPRSEPACAIDGYNYLGRLEKYKFEVGTKFLIFPIKREERSCVVVLDRGTWLSASKVNVEVPEIAGFLKADKVDRSATNYGHFDHRIDVTLMIPLDGLEVADVQKLAEDKVHEMHSRQRAFHGQKSTYEYVTRLSVKLPDHPRAQPVLCQARGRSGYMGATDSLDCSPGTIDDVRLRTSTRDGLTPSERRSAYDSLFRTRFDVNMTRQAKSYSQRAADNARVAAAIRSDDPQTAAALRATQKRLGLSDSQVALVEREARVLGWNMEELRP